MKPRKVALFIALDLAFLLALLLFLSYHGMSHLLIMAMGLLFPVLTLFDLKSGLFSAMFSDFLGLSGSDQLGNLRWLPVFLSLLLLFLSVPVFLEHGLINTTQRWAMQQGQLIRVAVPALCGGLAVIAVALWTVLSGMNNKK